MFCKYVISSHTWSNIELDQSADDVLVGASHCTMPWRVPSTLLWSIVAQQSTKFICVNEALIDGKIDLQSDDGIKLLQNLTQCFNFRLTNKFDHVTDDNKDELMKSKSRRFAWLKRKQTRNVTEEEEQEDEDDEYLTSAKEHKYNLIEIHQTSEGNTEGIGSVLWLLCKIFLNSNGTLFDSKDKSNRNDDDNDVPISDKSKPISSTVANNNKKNKDNKHRFTHIPLPQRLLIQQIVTKLYSLRIANLLSVMRPMWPKDTLDSSFSALSDHAETPKSSKKKKTLSAAEKKKKKKAEKARKKMLKKMRKQKEKFALNNESMLMHQEMEEALEQKQMSESFGIGIDQHCIVCKSKESQDTMLMMGFVKNCSLLHRCVDHHHAIQTDSSQSNLNDDDYLPTRKGLNFSFCGHYVHKQCHDTFVINKVRSHYRQEHYYGRGTLTINHAEYVCPYCKTVGNIVVPISKCYRNPQLNHEQFAHILDVTKTDQQLDMKMLSINDIKAEKIRNGSFTVRLPTASSEFFCTLFWIHSNYLHEKHSDMEFLNSLKSAEIAFTFCNSVAYTISSFEVLYRMYSMKQRKDKLTRNISVLNTLISVAWSRSQFLSANYFKLALVFKYSWDFVQRKVLKLSGAEEAKKNEEDNGDNDDYDDDEDEEEKTDPELDEKFCDPFMRLLCGFLSHPTTFLVNPPNTDNDDDDDDGDVAIADGTGYDSKKQTTLDFYQLILACYVMKLTQLLLVFVLKKSGPHNDDLTAYKVSDWQDLITKTLNSRQINDELKQELYQKMTVFLRKSFILYNTFFHKSVDELLAVLWSSVDEECKDDDNDSQMENEDEQSEANKVKRECDAICDLLHVPIISTLIDESWYIGDDYFKNYMECMNVRYVLKLSRHENVDGQNEFRLIELPNDYNKLFQLAAETKCEQKGKPPHNSGLCLFCGKIVCIDCCEKSVIDHCQDCNDGIGVILYFQKSSIILVWDSYATQYESVYLDKYGEPDRGLWRGVQLKFSEQRYKELSWLVLQHLIPNKMTQIRVSNRDLLETRLTL